MRPAGRRSPARSCACRSRRARARCSCSTPGSARCPRPTTRGFVLPHSAAVLAAVGELGVPRIHFGVGTGELLGADGGGRRRRRRAWTSGCRSTRPRAGSARTARCRATSTRPSLFAPWEAVARADPRRCSRPDAWPPGHVFNLGHGVLPETDPDVLARVVELVHEESALSCVPTRRAQRSDRVGVPDGRRLAAADTATRRVRRRAPSVDQERQQRTEHGQRDRRSDGHERVPAAAQPGQEAEVLVVRRRRRRRSGATRVTSIVARSVDVVERRRAAPRSDSRSASRRASSASTCTTSPIVVASPSRARSRATLRCWVATRLSMSTTCVVTSSAVCAAGRAACRARPSCVERRAELRRRHAGASASPALLPRGAAGRSDVSSREHHAVDAGGEGLRPAAARSSRS